MEKQIEDIFPIMDVEHDLIYSKSGDVTAAFRCILPEIFTLSHDEFDLLHERWVRGLKLLLPGTIVHKQDWFKTSKVSVSGAADQASFLDSSSSRFFFERPYLKHECYLFFSLKFRSERTVTSLTSSLVTRNLVAPKSLNTSVINEFLLRVQDCVSILNDTKLLSIERIKQEQIWSSDTKYGLIEQYLTLGHDHPIGDIRFDNVISVGELKAILFSLRDAEDLPSICGPRMTYEPYSSDHSKFSSGFGLPLGLSLSCNHLYNQYIFIENTIETIKRLETKKLRLQSLSAYSRENAIARDATNEFLNECIAQQRLPVKAHFNVLAWGRTDQELSEARRQVFGAMAQMEASPKIETTGAPQIFWAGVPGNAADFPMNDTFDTFAEQACCFLNLETNYRSSLSPFGIRLGDRLSGYPLHVDISDEPIHKGVCTNRNKFVLGPSGSGKSFFTNHLVRSYFEQGTHIVIVDVGHSYRGLCELLKGYYFTYDTTQPICFNPFYLELGERLDTEKRESLKALLLALWKKDDESFRRSEYVALSNALNLYYEFLQKDLSIFPCFNSFYEFLSSNFSNTLIQEAVKEKDFDIHNLLYVLRPYYKGGEFDFLLNAQSNLDLLEQRFIVFELDNIKDHPILFPIVTLIIMEVFISKMRKLKGVRKMILIEEAWKAIAKDGMAEYIKYLFKTVRKFYGEAVVVTQDVEDILSSPVVKNAIINNSDCKILLDQSKYENKFDQIQDLLGLTEKEKTQILSINKANDQTKKYKEVFISLGGRYSKVYRTEVSPEEYLTYTTEQSERLLVETTALRFGGDLRKSIQFIVNQKKENEDGNLIS
jgi:conjugation system TraG family ATPase